MEILEIVELLLNFRKSIFKFTILLDFLIKLISKYKFNTKKLSISCQQKLTTGRAFSLIFMKLFHETIGLSCLRHSVK